MMNTLYVHIPFCKNKCLYCSFVIAVGKQNYVDPYLESLAQEAEYYKGSEVETIYLGGGTPTFINVTQIVRLFEIIRANFKFAKGCEFTIEANPENIDVAKAELLHSLGVNRISLGVQSLFDKYLKYLGRPHDRRGALMAFEHLRQAGFDNINLDLMFSFPKQTLAEIEEDVRSITLLKSEHLSLYSLTIEEGSRFFREKVELDNDVCRAEHYLRIVEMLGEEGFEQYEISNFAKPEKQSRHNRNYWEGGNYIGLGVGAHSHQNGRRFWNTSNFSDYLSKTKERTPVDGEENLAVAERLMEALLFGLRMNEGVKVSILEERFREALSPDKKAIINELLKQGLLVEDKSRLKTTLEGRLVLDEISSRLI